MRLFNPLKEDFTDTYDINGDGQPKPYTLHSLEISEELPDIVAEHLANHLAKHYIRLRGIKTNREDEYTKALAIIKRTA